MTDNTSTKDETTTVAPVTSTTTAASNKSTNSTVSQCPINIVEFGTLPDDDAHIYAKGILACPLPLGYKATRSGIPSVIKTKKDDATSTEGQAKENSKVDSPTQSLFDCTFEVKAGPTFVITVSTISGSSDSSAPAAPRVYKATAPAAAWKVAKQIHNFDLPIIDGYTAFGFNNKTLADHFRQQALSEKIDVSEEIAKAVAQNDDSDGEGTKEADDEVPTKTMPTKGDDPLGGLKRFLIADGKLTEKRRKAAASRKSTQAAATEKATAAAKASAPSKGKKTSAPPAGNDNSTLINAASASLLESTNEASAAPAKKGRVTKPKCPLCKLSTPFCSANGQPHDFMAMSAAAAAAESATANVTPAPAAQPSSEPATKKTRSEKKKGSNSAAKEEEETKDGATPSIISDAASSTKKAPPKRSNSKKASVAPLSLDENSNVLPATQELAPSSPRKATPKKSTLSAFVAPPPQPAKGDPVIMTRISRPKRETKKEDVESAPSSPVVTSQRKATSKKVSAATTAADATKSVGSKRSASQRASEGQPSPAKKGLRTEGSSKGTKVAGSPTSAKSTANPLVSFSAELTNTENSISLLAPSTQTLPGKKRGRSTSTKGAATANTNITELIPSYNNSVMELPPPAMPPPKPDGGAKAAEQETKEKKPKAPRTTKTTVTKEVVEEDGTITTLIEEIVTPIAPKAAEVVELDEEGNPKPKEKKSGGKKQVQSKLSFSAPVEGGATAPTTLVIPPPPPPLLKAPFNKTQTKLAHDVFMKKGGFHSDETMTKAGLVTQGQKARFTRFIFQYSSERSRAELIKKVIEENNGILPDEFQPKKPERKAVKDGAATEDTKAEDGTTGDE